LAAAEGGNRPVAEHDRCTARLALHLSPHLLHDPAAPCFKELDRLEGALTPCSEDRDVEVPDGFAAPDYIGLWPVPRWNALGLGVLSRQPASPVAPVERIHGPPR